jgi:hypothetical protein
MRYTFRPLAAWTDPETPDRRSSNVFKADWDSTLRLLRFEAEQLDASSMVVQVVTTEADLRQDGMLRTRAQVLHPGAVVSLDTPRGPLRFATDMYEQRWGYGLTSWQANVRAIALGLEALRAVDRYGITHRAEQYRGWLQLTAGDGAPTTLEEALALLDSFGGPKAAVRATHPDRGGDPQLFRRVMAARRLIEQNGGGVA